MTTSGILFPHTFISVQDLETIRVHFSGLTVCQPWFMESPFPNAEDTDLSMVHIQYPPEAFKPKEDLKRRIAQYRLWLKENPDRAYGTFLRAISKTDITEDSPWEIRKLIARAGGEKHPEVQQEQTLRWHLILHLAREFEESKWEAEAMLKALKQQKSPIEEALEEAPPQSFLEHTLMETGLRVDGYDLGQVFEAWFGLFGEVLPAEVPLITWDPEVVNYALERGGEPDDDALNDLVRRGLVGRKIVTL
jgi:hypothetical protein